MIFVFGSNLDGIHGAGAARYARLNHGAQMGIGEGPTGNAYALPTVGHQLVSMEQYDVAMAIGRFLRYAKDHPDLEFQVTRVGCGLAGFRDSEIAHLFRRAPVNCLFDEAWKEYLPDAKFWGTF